MKTPITACLLALSLAACVSTPPNQQTTSTGQVPLARIYIQSMTVQNADLAEVQFSRAAGFFLSNSPQELAINDVVLAQIWPGERLSIWLKPNTSYTFSVKPQQSLRSDYATPPTALTLDLKGPSVYKVRISSDVKGTTMQADN